MSKHSVNAEGFTFEEWACAAGCAVFSGESVRQYSESHLSYTFVGLSRSNPELIRLDTPTPARHLLRPTRRTTTFYPRRIRNAWLAGEDPSEYRAYRKA